MDDEVYESFAETAEVLFANLASLPRLGFDATPSRDFGDFDLSIVDNGDGDRNVSIGLTLSEGQLRVLASRIAVALADHERAIVERRQWHEEPQRPRRSPIPDWRPM